MALSVSYTIPIINPAYTPLEFTMSAPGCDYMELDVYIGDASMSKYGGTKRTIRIVSTSVVADIQNVVQPFFESDASAAVNFKRIDVHAHSYIGNTLDGSVYVDCFWIFNGVNNTIWDPSIYLMDNSVGHSKFLNNWDAPINIHWGDENTKLYFFQGIFQNSKATVDVKAPSFKVYVDGRQTGGYTYPINTTPRIRTLSVGPSALNALIGNANITSSTKSYTIDQSLNTTSYGVKTINIVPKDDRYDAKRVAYVDSMGCIDYFNFDLANTNTINVTRNVFNNNGVFRTFNNKVVDTYTLTSNWITEEESLALKDLWYAPSIMVDGNYVNITNKNIQISKRRDVKLINYTVDYETSREYKTQIF